MGRGEKWKENRWWDWHGEEWRKQDWAGGEKRKGEVAIVKES